jgi:hypothetical protein
MKTALVFSLGRWGCFIMFPTLCNTGQGTQCFLAHFLGIERRGKVCQKRTAQYGKPFRRNHFKALFFAST